MDPEKRQETFLQAAQAKANYTSNWKMTKLFGVSNRSVLIDGGLQVGVGNLDAWAVVPQGVIFASLLRFPPASEIYFAILVKDDCDRLIQRLQNMKKAGIEQREDMSQRAYLSQSGVYTNDTYSTSAPLGLQYSTRNNLVAIYLADDGKIYLRNKGFWNSLHINKDDLGPTVLVDKILFGIYPPEAALEKDSVNYKFSKDYFNTLVGPNKVEEITPWPNKAPRPTRSTEGSTLWPATTLPTHSSEQMSVNNFTGPIQGLFIGDGNRAVINIFGDGEKSVPFFAPPRPRYELVGRDDMLNTVKQRLFSGEKAALSAFKGLPGVGKTAIALALVYDQEILAHFQGGVLWAGLGREPNISSHLNAWATTLGISQDELSKMADNNTLIAAIKRKIGNGKLLLVLDDAWTIEAAQSLQIGGPNCSYLVTTRKIDVAETFAPGNCVQLRELNADASLLLLEHVAGEEIIQLAPDEARELVHAVKGLPLPLTLMGNYLRIQIKTGQMRRIRDALTRLQTIEARLTLTQPREGSEHHPSLPADVPLSLQAVIKISDEALSEDGRQALRALSVFPPKPSTFSETAALEVTATHPRIIDELFDSGLLEHSVSERDRINRAGLRESRTDDRYTLHQTISDYARMELTDTAVYDRMVEFIKEYVKSHQGEQGSLEREMSNILAAIEIILDRDPNISVFTPIIRSLRVRGI